MECIDATFSGPASFYAVKCGSSGFFAETKLEGELSLTRAKIGGNLTLDNACPHTPDGDILVGERRQVGRVLFF